MAPCPLFGVISVIILCLILGEVGVKGSIPVTLRRTDLLQLAVVPSSIQARWLNGVLDPNWREMSAVLEVYRM